MHECKKGKSPKTLFHAKNTRECEVDLVFDF